MPVPIGLAFVGASSTGVTPVAAAPTTAAHFLLWNGDPLKSYYVTSLSCSTTASAAATENLQLFAHLSVAGLAVIPTGGTAALGPKPLGGGPAQGSLAQIVTAATIVNDGIWHVVGPSQNAGAATATIALGTWANVNGLYVIRPGGLLSLAVVTSTAAGTAKCYATWVEV